jgi:hypothetical protein
MYIKRLHKKEDIMKLKELEFDNKELPKEIILKLANNRELHIELQDVKYVSPIMVEAKIQMSTQFIRSIKDDCVTVI